MNDELRHAIEDLSGDGAIRDRAARIVETSDSDQGGAAAGFCQAHMRVVASAAVLQANMEAVRADLRDLRQDVRALLDMNAARRSDIAALAERTQSTGRSVAAVVSALTALAVSAALALVRFLLEGRQ